MTLIHSIAARIELVLPKSFTVLNLLSAMLLGLTLVLPVTSSIAVLVVSMAIQAAFFRVMHREKAGMNKLITRLAYLIISSTVLLVILYQHPSVNFI